VQWGTENKGIGRLPRHMQSGNGKSGSRLVLINDSNQKRLCEMKKLLF